MDNYETFFRSAFGYLLKGGRKRIRTIEKDMVKYWFSKLYKVNPSFSQPFNEDYLPKEEVFCYVYVKR